MDVEYTALSIIAPMTFLIMMKHSLAPCVPHDYPLDPLRYIDVQADNLLRGLHAQPPGAQP